MIIVQVEKDELRNLISEAVQKAVSEIPTQRVPESVQWFNLSEFCEYHPDKPSVQTAYKWVQTGKVPCHKSGKKLRFLKSEIDNWLKDGKRKTLEETGHIANEYVSNRKGYRHA
jgi:excisionase family DNA binding protein